jgi:predicted DNA-binding protein
MSTRNEEDMKSEHLHIRVSQEDQIRIRQLALRHAKKASKIIRMAIRYAYANEGGFDYFMAKANADE